MNDTITIEHSPTHATQAYTGKIHIGTYNIAHGRGPKLGRSNWSGGKEEKKARLLEIGKYLKQQHLDIVLLNEVDFSANWSGNLDQAQLIAEAGEFPYVARQVNYDFLLPGFSLQFGNALLSRFPIQSAKRERLPALKPLEQWFYGNHNALKAKITLGPTTVSIWGLHLEVRDEKTRIRATEHILHLLNDEAILMGDLNSRPSSQKKPTAYTILQSSNKFRSFPHVQPKYYTFPAEKPTRTLDWLFFPKNWALIQGTVRNVQYSDHLPVSVELKIK